jgi:hypothetical protein
MTRMIFFYITLAADFLSFCFYDLLFETDNKRASLIRKINQKIIPANKKMFNFKFLKQ